MHRDGVELLRDRERLINSLADARLQGLPSGAADIEGDLEDALGLQLDVLRAIEKRGLSQSGWKVGLTSGGAHDLMGPGFRPFGYILAERTLQSGAFLSEGPKLLAQVEPELCLQMKTDLRGRDITPDECRAAVAETRAAFEINETRVTMPGPNKLFIADGLSNWGLVLGEGAPPRDGLAATHVDLYRDDLLVESRAVDHMMDDPYVSLSRLCARLDRYGLGVQAGQHVITGAFFRYSIATPGRYRAHFSGIGDVTLDVA